MFEHVLRQMRDLIRTSQYVMTLHAVEEMDDDELSVFDIERGILTGQIIERQKDQRTGEWKYLVEGQTIDGDTVVTIAKLSITGKLVIITTYLQLMR